MTVSGTFLLQVCITILILLFALTWLEAVSVWSVDYSDLSILAQQFFSFVYSHNMINMRKCF
jgi:hypothetical protein